MAVTSPSEYLLELKIDSWHSLELRYVLLLLHLLHFLILLLL